MRAQSLRQAVLVLLASCVLTGVLGTSRFARAQVPDTSETHLSRGIHLMQGGNFERARAEFETAVRLNPRLARAYILLGVAENQLGDFAEAVQTFRQALKLDPRSDAAHYNLALSLLRLERNDDAIEELEQAVKLNPKLDVAQYNLGLLLSRTGRYQESIERLEAARAHRPGDPAILVHLVEAYFKVDHKARALELAREAIDGDSNGQTSARLGAFLLDQGYYEEAVRALEKARGLAPDSTELTTLLARAYLAAGKSDQASKLLETLPAQQTNWQVHYLLGLAYGATGQTGPAARSYREALRLKPEEPEIHYSLGKLLLKSKDEVDQKAGVKAVHQAIHLNPLGTEYYVTLGRWLLNKNQLLDAADLLKRALSNVPRSAEVYLMLGLAEAELHGAGAAMPFVQKAIELDRQSAPAFNILGNLYLRLGDDQSAAESFKQAIRLSSQNALYFYNVTVPLERLNEIAEAVSFAEKAVRLKPDSAFYHYMLGKLYAKLDRTTEAIKELQACVQLDPKIEYPYYLLARTYLRIGDQVKAQEWGHKLQGLKEERDRAVGLLAPASETHQLLDSSIPPWETSGMGPPRPAGSPP